MYDQNRNILDTNEGYAPLTYLHGHGYITAEFEKAVEVMNVNEQKEIIVDSFSSFTQDDNVMVANLPVIDNLTSEIKHKAQQRNNDSYHCCNKVISVNDAQTDETKTGFPWKSASRYCNEDGCC